MISVSSKITGNSLFIFIIVAFAVWILGQTDAMASFTEDIYAALGDMFDFLPIVAVVGALGYMSGKKG